jgi:hypothetical protein
VTFLKYLTLAESVRIRIGKREVQVERARLGQYLLLGELHRDVGEAIERGEPEGIVSSLRSYLEAACLCHIAENLRLQDLTDACEPLWRMNAFRESLAFMRPDPKAKPDQWEVGYEYRDRHATLWIDTIASDYHWDEATILNLWPEQAACYYQEILLRQAQRQEWEYIIHGLGVGKGGTYKPLPKPKWMGARPKDQIMRIPKSMLPQGLIIRAGDVEKT